MTIRDKLIHTIMRARKEWGVSYMDTTGNLAVFEVDAILAEFDVMEKGSYIRAVTEVTTRRIDKHIEGHEKR